MHIGANVQKKANQFFEDRNWEPVTIRLSQDEWKAVNNYILFLKLQVSDLEELVEDLKYDNNYDGGLLDVET